MGRARWVAMGALFLAAGCRAPGNIGEACEKPADCESGLYCDPVNLICRMIVATDSATDAGPMGSDAASDSGTTDAGPPAPVPVDIDQRLQACVVLTACGHSILDSLATSIICGDPTLAEGFGLRPVAEGIIGCLLAAPAAGDTCSAAAQCLNDGSPPTPCAPGRSCSGDHIQGCSAGGTTAFDCGAVGLTCADDLSGEPTCGMGSCDPMMFSPECDGDLLHSCANGILVDLDCGWSGTTCIDGGGMPLCGGGGPPCDGTFVESCDGDDAHFCSAGNEAVLDCATLGAGRTCIQLGPVNVTCGPTAMDCADIADDDCNGDTVALCFDGTWWTYDCATLGFSSCVVVMNRPECVP